MQKRDLIKHQIEQMGQALGRLVAALIGVKPHEADEEELREIQKESEDTLGFSPESIVSMESSALIRFLIDNKLQLSHIEQLADIFREYSRFHHQSSLFKEKALFLYEYVNQESKTYSFDRQTKINSLS